ncbi:MAG: S8 family serine peptidase [Bacillota bacterium]
MRLKRLLCFILLVIVITAAGGAAGDTSAESGRAQLLNDRSGQIIGADLLSAPGFITPAGLTGAGQTVAVADSGIDRGSMEDVHPDLASEPGKKPKILMLKSWAGRKVADDPVGHGTHMVGTIAGSGSASGGKFRGVAPGAGIYFQGILDENGKISPPADIDNLFMPAYQAGARIHVDAWGSGDNRYSGTAMKADAFMRKYPDFLAIFGAGNAGPGAKSLTSEANSKNALVVGSSVSPRPALDFSPGDTLEAANFSSRGPAGDGRIKPDLLAPGTSIISTRSGLVKGNLPGFPMYSRMQGSSMASAVAAGAVALLREYMQRDMAVPDPRAASIKAALVNGARTPDSGPSQEGFGVLDLAGTVLALQEKTMVLAEENAGLPEGGAKTYRVRVEDSGSPLKVTLAWTDPAGELLAQKALVNNLDLAVTGPNGKTYYGNGFLGGAPDTLNNVEQVYIKNPEPGDYVIEVRAASVKGFAARGAPVPGQDYSLVYGQPLATGIIKWSARGGVIYLYGGQQVNQSDKNIRYLLNGGRVSSMKPEPGFRVYYNSRSLYIAGRLWEQESVRTREGTDGRIWFEMDQEAREGGYYQSPETEKGLIVNGTYIGDIAGLPPGISLRASLDGVTQTLWHLTSDYLTEKGSVARTGPGENGSITSIELFGGKARYPVSSRAGYTYNDSFERTDPLEMVFGSGNLNGMRKVMPGQQVTLVMPPAARVVSSILVDRSIASGYVTAVDPAGEKITIGPDSGFHVFSGAGVQKDRSEASLKDIAPGDYVMAVIIPGSREILGLAAYSNVVYGRVLFTSARDNSVYMSDLYNRFQMFRLSPETEVRRWGLTADASTLSSGTWVRVTLSPDRSEVWRMDVAELLEDEQKRLASIEIPYMTTSDGERYRASSYTTVTKEGLPVTAEDLLPGEKITVVSLLAPAPFNKVPVAVRAGAREGAKSPLLAATVREENGGFALSGYTTGDRLYIWHENGMREDIPVGKERRAFTWPLKFLENEDAVKVVAVNRSSGGVTGRTVTRSEVAARKFTDIAGHWAEGAITSIAAGGIMAGYGDGTFRPDQPVTRAELDMLRAAVRGFSPTAQVIPSFGGRGDPGEIITRASFMVNLKNSYRNPGQLPRDYTLPFRDCGGVTEKEREAVAWGHYRGLIKGRSRDTFAPEAPLTRAEVAAVIQRLLEKP